MSELHSRLRQIAAAQGREYIDGTVIEGFGGPGEAPTPSGLPPGFDPDQFTAAPDDFEDEPQAPASPLVQLGRAAEYVERAALSESPLQGAGPTPTFKPPDLAIFANEGAACVASYQGREVELSEAERDAVKRVVLQALVNREMAELDKVVPRRKRARVAVSTGSGVEPEAAAPAPKRRVRRKSLLKDP